MEISYFENLRNVRPTRTVDFQSIFDSIKSGTWKSTVLECRTNPELKRTLHCFTPTGIFIERKLSGLINYTGVICLDIDNIDNPSHLKEISSKIPWVWASFITPSSRGLKILVRTDSKATDYKFYEAVIAQSFFDYTGVCRDIRSTDITRLQFVSFDEKIFVNDSPIIFKKGTA